MKIEHLALQVTDPVAMADWYCKNLGFTVKRSADAPVPVRFIADNSGNTILEIYNNPKAPMPDYSSMDPLLLHIAFACASVAKTIEHAIELVHRLGLPAKLLPLRLSLK